MTLTLDEGIEAIMEIREDTKKHELEFIRSIIPNEGQDFLSAEEYDARLKRLNEVREMNEMRITGVIEYLHHRLDGKEVTTFSSVDELWEDLEN